jgi:hypothetical protein
LANVQSPELWGEKIRCSSSSSTVACCCSCCVLLSQANAS